jgi:hypothetical protein
LFALLDKHSRRANNGYIISTRFFFTIVTGENTLVLNHEITKSIFDGRYSWDGKKKDRREPIAWFPGAYDLKILDLTFGKKNITFLKPFLCIYTNTGAGYSISEHPEKFAKNVCRDFSLDMEKVLWVEKLDREQDIFEIISFVKCGILGDDSIYLIKKRKPRDNEMRLISKVMKE